MEGESGSAASKNRATCRPIRSIVSTSAAGLTRENESTHS